MISSKFTCTVKSISLVIALLAICITACNKPKEKSYTKTIYCTDPHIYAMFVNYQDSDLTSVLVKTYAKGSSFATLVSESSDTVNHKGFGEGYRQILDQAALLPDYDYELILPDVNDTFRISGITIDKRADTSDCVADGARVSCVPEYCFNYLRPENIYLAKNGQLDTPVNFTSFSPGSTELMVFER